MYGASPLNITATSSSIDEGEARFLGRPLGRLVANPPLSELSASSSVHGSTSGGNNGSLSLLLDEQGIEGSVVNDMTLPHCHRSCNERKFSSLVLHDVTESRKM